MNIMEPNEIVRALRIYHQSLTPYQLGNEFADAINDGADCIEKLQAELEASRRRERAAVEDLHGLHTTCMSIGDSCPECGDQIDDLIDAACYFCKKNGVSCWVETPGNENKCAAFEWRRPEQEGE